MLIGNTGLRAMASGIKTVGVIGTGTIGSSWTALFLSRGLQVLVSDPAPGAEKALAKHLDKFWPTLEEIGLSPGANLQNYRFVGANLEKYYDQVDFIQEVREQIDKDSAQMLTSLCRMLQKDLLSRPNSLARLMQELGRT